jgi:peroxiredoxin
MSDSRAHADHLAPGHPVRPRAQRRAAEREEHTHQRRTIRRVHLRQRIAVALIAAVLVVAAGYAGISHLRANSKTLPALTTVAALDPSTSLIPREQIAPGFHLKDASGSTYSLWAQHGHPVLLEFFATWCPVCHHEAPVMERIERAYAAKGVRVWSVLANPYGRNYELSGRTDLSLATVADLHWYAKTYGATYPLLVDPAFTTVNRYGAGQYPTLYVIGKTGMVSYAASGLETYSTLSGQIDRVLKTR